MGESPKDSIDALVGDLEEMGIPCTNCNGVEIAEIYSNDSLQSYVSPKTHVAVIGPGAEPAISIDLTREEQNSYPFFLRKNRPMDTTVYDFMVRLSEGHLTLIDVSAFLHKLVDMRDNNNMYGINNIYGVKSFLKDIKRRGARLCDMTFLKQNLLKKRAARKISGKLSKHGNYESTIIVDHRSWEFIFPLMEVADGEKWDKLAELYSNICHRLRGNTKVLTYFDLSEGLRAEPVKDVIRASRAYRGLGATLRCYYNFEDVHYVREPSLIAAIESGYELESVYKEPSLRKIVPRYPTSVLIVASLN